MLLLRRVRRMGVVARVYLFWLHAVVGAGYLFLPLYREWLAGDALPVWESLRFGELSHEALTISLVLAVLICGLLLLFTFLCPRWPSASQSARAAEIRRFRACDALVVTGFVTIYGLGLLFGTLRVGIGLRVVLPMRLNGVIEVVTLTLLPFYVALRMLALKKGFWVGLAIMLLYGLNNLTCFGSKYSAILPVAVFVSVYMSHRRLRVVQVVLPLAAIALLYSFLNPYYFRVAIRDGHTSSPVEMIIRSAHSARDAVSGPQRYIIGLRNLSHRITGIAPMQIAIESTLRRTSWGRRPFVREQVGEFYNYEILDTGEFTRNACGHFGFFILLFDDHVVGFVVGCIVLCLYLAVALWLDSRAQRTGSRVYTMLGVLYVLTLFAGRIRAAHGCVSDTHDCVSRGNAGGS